MEKSPGLLLDRSFLNDDGRRFDDLAGARTIALMDGIDPALIFYKTLLAFWRAELIFIV